MRRDQAALREPLTRGGFDKAISAVREQHEANFRILVQGELCHLPDRQRHATDRVYLRRTEQWQHDIQEEDEDREDGEDDRHTTDGHGGTEHLVLKHPKAAVA